jgi:hypothetical protein
LVGDLAFKGRDPTRSKIVINNKIMEQINTFNYLGNFVSYDKERGTETKLQFFLQITNRNSQYTVKPKCKKVHK